MAEGYQDNKKSNSKELCDKLSVTISGTTRTSTREKHITDRLELDPSKQSYDTKKQSEPVTVEHKPVDTEDNNELETLDRRTPKMAPRRCKAEGCDYEVGKDGAVPEGQEIEDLKLHYVTCPFLTKT